MNLLAAVPSANQLVSLISFLFELQELTWFIRYLVVIHAATAPLWGSVSCLIYQGLCQALGGASNLGNWARTPVGQLSSEGRALVLYSCTLRSEKTGT